MLWISLTLQFYLNHLSILNNHCNELFASSCLLQTVIDKQPSNCSTVNSKSNMSTSQPASIWEWPGNRLHTSHILLPFHYAFVCNTVCTKIYLTVSVYKMYLLLIFKHSCTGTHTYCSVCLHSLPLKVIQLWQSSLPAATYPPPPKPLGSGRQQSSARFTIPSSLPSQVLVASLKLAKQNCDCAATEIRNDYIIHW